MRWQYLRLQFAFLKSGSVRYNLQILKVTPFRTVLCDLKQPQSKYFYHSPKVALFPSAVDPPPLQPLLCSRYCKVLSASNGPILLNAEEDVTVWVCSLSAQQSRHWRCFQFLSVRNDVTIDTNIQISKQTYVFMMKVHFL